MSRVQEERDYWNKAALDPDVDVKFIADVLTEDCLVDLGELKGEVLEIGCGVGRLMRDGFYGIDISEEMLKIAKMRQPKCHFKLTDGRSIPYEDEKFDTVYSYLVFQHLPLGGVEAYIEEAYRVLKEGGRFVFQWITGDEDEPFSKHHDLADVLNILDETGFEHMTKKSSLYSGWWITEAKK